MKENSIQIVFKTNAFPQLSETFIVSNIVEAIKQGFSIKIIVDLIKSEKDSSQPELLEKYGIMEKVFTVPSPKNKLKRYLKALQYLIHPLLFFYFLKYEEQNSKI